MQTQIIIVGFGIAGANLAFTLYKRGIDFIVIDEHREVTSSKVAAGLYNPITGRRAVKTWLADELFPFAQTFYQSIEEELNITLLNDRNGYRLYKEDKDQAKMLRKSQEPQFKGYLNTDFEGLNFKENIQDMGGVEILQSGNLSISPYLDAFKQKLTNEGTFRDELFEYDQLSSSSEQVQYKDISAEKVIFAEGFRAMDNPFFSWLPFAVTKGEMLKIKSTLPQTHIINKGFFILPIGNSEFLVGSSYERVVDESITEKGRKTVSDKLDALLKVPYKIIGQYAAVRPTVLDRKPFLGVHPENKNVFIFNGMGTKGVTLSPYFAEQFVNHLFSSVELNSEVNIERYHSLYLESKKT